MKKLFFAAILVVFVAAFFSSCTGSRKVGCPGTEGIIH